MNHDDDQRDEADREVDPADDHPSLRQRLHAATGDRDAEAKALRDRSESDVSERDAKVAVQRARGEAGADQPTTEQEIATPTDAAEVRHERSHAD